MTVEKRHIGKHRQPVVHDDLQCQLRVARAALAGFTMASLALLLIFAVSVGGVL